MNIIALDIGSVATKGLMWSVKENSIKAVSCRPSAWQPTEAAAGVVAELISCDCKAPCVLAATGYGRNLLESGHLADLMVESAQREFLRFNEITALARGLNKVSPEVRLILDVGGQDSKALSIDDKGRIIDFLLNDKCAAGAGAFIDGVCQSFNLNHQEFGQLAERGQPVPLSSMCAVFAQTELVDQIAKGVKREDLAAGILASLAARLKTQCGRLFTKNPVALTGGLSRMPVFARMLSDGLGVPVVVPPQAPYLAALGTALLAVDEAFTE